VVELAVERTNNFGVQSIEYIGGPLVCCQCTRNNERLTISYMCHGFWRFSDVGWVVLTARCNSPAGHGHILVGKCLGLLRQPWKSDCFRLYSICKIETLYPTFMVVFSIHKKNLSMALFFSYSLHSKPSP